MRTPAPRLRPALAAALVILGLAWIAPPRALAQLPGSLVVILKSEDGGVEWTSINLGLTDLSVHAVKIDPATPTTLYAGTNAAGVFKSVDGGLAWSAINAGLSSLQVFDLAIDPLTPTSIYAATGGGVFALQQGIANPPAVAEGSRP